MRRISSRLRRSTGGTPDDAGIAMVVAIAVIMIVTAVIATIVVLALRETGLSGRERQRGVAIASAEGQVDNLVSRINQTSVASLVSGSLCGTVPAFTTTVGRDTLTVTSSVGYYRRDASGAPVQVSCADLATGTVAATTAVVNATSTSTALAGKAPAVRNFETVIGLTLNPNMNQAIFGETGVTITGNNTVIAGASGANDADVYSNGYVNCRGYVYGSIYAQTTVDLTSDCDWVAGNVVAKGNVIAQANSMTMVGDITSSNGAINLTTLGSAPNKVFNGTALALSGVTGAICPGPKCNTSSTLSPPPTSVFPQVSRTPANWVGFATHSITSCATSMSDPTSLGWWLKNVGPTLTQNTRVLMPDNCTVDFGHVGGSDVVLNKDVAIFAKGTGAAGGLAFHFTASPGFQGTSGGDVKSLYFIQDYQTPVCGLTGIKVQNHLEAVDNIRVMFYTPHTFHSRSGNSDLVGQIFSGCVAKIDDVMNLTYSPLPMQLVDNITAMSYGAEIQAKRETS